jgi:hypothetical protein
MACKKKPLHGQRSQGKVGQKKGIGVEGN